MKQRVQKAGRVYSAWNAGNLVIYPGFNGDVTEYFVDSVNGSDNNDGLSWERATQTIMAAVNLARRLPGTTTLDTTKDHHTIVNIAPGHYNGEDIWYAAYNVHLVGCGPIVPGKDYGVSINYDGAQDTNAVILTQGSGNSIENLHIYCAEAIPAILWDNGDNNYIGNCVIECDGTNATYGIQANSLKGSWIKDTVIINPTTAGIYGAGGANHYTINGGIENCQIIGAATGVKGIYIENTMTAYNFRINHNFIDVEAGGATSIGIDNNASGNVFITDNYVTVETAATAIESAGHGILNNHVSVNGTVTDPFDDD